MALINIPAQYAREVGGSGQDDAPILLVVDHSVTSDLPANIDVQPLGRPMSGAMGSVYLSQFRAVGIERHKFRIEAICPHSRVGKGGFYSLSRDEQAYWRADFMQRFEELNPALVIPAGNEALRLLTGKSSLSKWHLSAIQTTQTFRSLPALPLLAPTYVMKIFGDMCYIAAGAQRAKEMLDGTLAQTERNFIIHPTLKQVSEWAEKALAEGEWLCTDVETSSGLVTCVGFSVDPREAICVPTQPGKYTQTEFFELWKLIARLLESPLKKTNQNIPYDTTYLASYGVRTRNICWDTMPAMRFLYPEMSKGLDTIARIFTNEPYWKDEAKDWTARQNEDELYIYNCKDAAVTLEATFAQMQEMRERGQLETFQSLVLDCLVPFLEMSWTGLPVRKGELEKLRKESQDEFAMHAEKLNEISQQLLGKDINPQSHAQVKDFLRAAGFRIPRKDGRETSDYETLLKLRLKSPENEALNALIRISKLKKEISSYLNYRYYERDSRMRAALYVCSTKTWRGSGGTDPWSRGINPQTVPRGRLRGQFGYD